MSPDLKWVAVTVGPAGAKGFDFYLGQFKEAEQEVQLIKNLILKEKIDFHFAPDRLYFTELAECTGPSCQYGLKYLDLVKLSQQPDPIFVFPPAEALEQSTFKGHFKVSPDGKQLVFLNTTIRSVGIYLWRDGTGLVELDFICKYGTKDDCQGTGSEYSDLDPVAISNDGRYIVFFTFSDRWQMARIYDTSDPQLINQLIMAAVPSGGYLEKICDFGNLKSWQWQRVVLDPVFTPDDSEIVFLTETACKAPNGEIPDKAQRNLLRIKMSRLLQGGQVAEADVFNVTQSPQGNLTANKFVSGFALSPDGATIVFTATPTYTGGPPFDFAEKIEDGNIRQESDRELYRVRRDGKFISQLTGDVSWEVQSPKIVPPAATGP